MTKDDIRRVGLDPSISVGNVLTLLTVLIGVVSGIWVVSGQFNSSRTQLDELVREVRQGREEANRQADDLLRRLAEEARLREKQTDEAQTTMAQLNRRLDEFLLEKHGEVVPLHKPQP